MPNVVELFEQALLAIGTLEFYRGWNAARALDAGTVYKPADAAQMERYRRMAEEATAAALGVQPHHTGEKRA